MKPSEALAKNRDAIRDIVLAHRARNPRVFGSTLSGDDTDISDLDLLVDAAPGMTLLDLGAIRYKLREMLGISVDVLTPKALPDAFRERVLAEAIPV
jgi:predicted nucleotidyltransferase